MSVTRCLLPRSVLKMLMLAMAGRGQWDSVKRIMAGFRAQGQACFAASTMTTFINLAARAKQLDTCAPFAPIWCCYNRQMTCICCYSWCCRFSTVAQELDLLTLVS